jgi:hypothetical protein
MNILSLDPSMCFAVGIARFAVCLFALLLLTSIFNYIRTKSAREQNVVIFVAFTMSED